MKRSPRKSTNRRTHGLSGMSIFALTLVTIFVVDAMAQPATTPAKNSQNTVTAPVYGPNVPKGFMDLEFGTSLEDAENILATRNYKFVKRQGWQLILTHVPLAGFSAEEVKLSFSSEAGFNKGEALIKVVCDKSYTQGVEAFDKISRTIHSKYRRFPKVEEKLTKEKKSYWTMEWEFKTKDNKQTACEIKLYMQEVWPSRDTDWKNLSKIFITYFAPWAVGSGPIAPEPPSEGL